MRPSSPLRASRFVIRAVSVSLLLFGILVGARSLGWRGARFPGFFLMPNRVVPSAGLPAWNGPRDGRPLYQEVLLAVDDVPVVSSAAGYARVAAHPVGQNVRYTFSRDGAADDRSFPVLRFTDSDYGATFGMYFLSGLAYVLLGLLAGERWDDRPLYRGLAVFSWVSAAFAFSGIDLYGPGHFFRLHALVEACLPAAAAHLALVCPRDRSAGRAWLVSLAWALTLALAAVYEMFLYEPRAYSAIHNAAQVLAGLPVVVLASLLAMAQSDPPPGLGARAARWLFGGAVGGMVIPGAVFALSGLSGGLVPVHVTAWVGFAFPLSCVAALWPLQAPQPALVSSNA